MHLLAAQPRVIADGREAVDLGQTPGDIVVLTAADTEIACLAEATRHLRESAAQPMPRVRLANLTRLAHNMSVDLYVEKIVGAARLVVLRLLGGRGYWPYGVDEIARVCRERGIALAMVPGDDQPDAELQSHSTLGNDITHRLWQFLVNGGIENAENLLRYSATLIGHPLDWNEPIPLLRAGLYWPGSRQPMLDDVRRHWPADAPVASLIFYRALVQAGNLRAVDALIESLVREGLGPLPIFVSSLKDPVSASLIETLHEGTRPSIILNTTGFSVSAPGARSATPFDGIEAPVLQVVFASDTEAAWSSTTRGLSARDIAMNVALPEVDGRVLSRAVSFKDVITTDRATETDVVGYRPVGDRVDHVAALARNWTKLRRTAPEDRRVALILANYPNRDGRIGNGVGLDTPASALTVMEAMRTAGYDVRDAPADSSALITQLLDGPTNARPTASGNGEEFSLADYAAWFSALPRPVQEQVTARWGPPERDPFFRPGRTDCGAFRIAALRCGNLVVGIQPARGYNIDPQKSYHDPALVPPHGYLAFYAWLRDGFRAQAIIHLGKHGNLEWLPGKSLALSSACFPDAILGPMPHLYPFIVNDPGEGTQAKRRASAVIIDHLTPPLTRAESYGPLKDLEALVDEYYEASGVDPRRLKVLGRQILDHAARLGLDRDCAIAPDDDELSALSKLDNHLCELKEMQIRDGLHVFGRVPAGDQLTDLLVALLRVPRDGGMGGNASLIRAIAGDLELDFDPLDCRLADPWTGPRPGALGTDDGWRTKGDTVERIEGLAHSLVAGTIAPETHWGRTAAVLDHLRTVIRPAVLGSGESEQHGLLDGLDGRFVKPGPSGAPTRGRADVLPTGRNFYSVDTRTVPTPAAWQLGWKAASLLVERYAQDHGEFPKTLALSAWGTSNMRTGGDDIAQALALMGVRPTWDTASRRVTGFEILPAGVLDRPRVDVTLRISGFFRDAFPNLIDLFDSAVRAVAALDEPESVNPLAGRARTEREELLASGLTAAEADRRSIYRVFGSKPGAYGAGLQALIDERGWTSDADLARAYVVWGGYAYGAGAEGQAAHQLFERRLSNTQAVLQNQDNREHDILDSDDYYQFEGGLAAAVRSLSGEQPALYHGDHARPESPRIRTLQEEIGRVVRARVVNPKWIQGVMRHGYKGAFEMAATVDYLFAFAATARVVGDHHFDAVFDAYIRDDDVRGFLEAHNPAALRDMGARLLEAQARGLWRPRANSTHGILQNLVADGGT